LRVFPLTAEALPVVLNGRPILHLPMAGKVNVRNTVGPSAMHAAAGDKLAGTHQFRE
jgi:hypothetical protein